MDLVHSNGLMDKNMLENGKMDLDKEEAKCFYQMDL